MPKRSRDDDDELSSLMGKTSLQPLRRAPRRSARQVADTMREEEQRSKRRRQSAREIKKEQGFFDGRFVTRAVKSKKDFSRKIKHKNNNN